MHLFEVFLPVTDRVTILGEVERLSRLLTDKFGGVTAFMRSNAKGRWEDERAVVRDEIVIVEVMADAIDRAWWYALRKDLEERLDQDEIVIRTHPIERL